MKKMAEESKNAAQKKGQQIVSEQINNITENFIFDKKNKCIEENFILEDIFNRDIYMNEIDKVTKSIGNFKIAY